MLRPHTGVSLRVPPDNRLGLSFGIEPEFRLNLQAHSDLVEARQANAGDYEASPRRAS